MGKGSGGGRGEGGEGIGNNRLTEGDDYWNGVGGIGDVSLREDDWGDGENFSRYGEVGRRGR